MIAIYNKYRSGLKQKTHPCLDINYFIIIFYNNFVVMNHNDDLVSERNGVQWMLEVWYISNPPIYIEMLCRKTLVFYLNHLFIYSGVLWYDSCLKTMILTLGPSVKSSMTTINQTNYLKIDRKWHGWTINSKWFQSLLRLPFHGTIDWYRLEKRPSISLKTSMPLFILYLICIASHKETRQWLLVTIRTRWF